MRIERLAIPEVVLITPPRFGDDRGFFSETWRQDRLEAAGIAARFVQDNHSRSVPAGVVRGLHCQIGAAAQGKLVRVVRGAIWDVAVDIRAGSPSFGQYVAAELTAENWAQLWVPEGFLHGFCTTAPDTEVIYKVTTHYAPDAERGVAWNDPTIALPWPVAPENAVLSGKDAALPGFAACHGWFAYDP